MKEKLLVTFSDKYRGWYWGQERKESAQKEGLSWQSMGSEAHRVTYMYMWM